MVIKAVVFDLGGVLVRTEDFTSREKLAKRLNITRRDLEELVFSGESGTRAQRGEIDIEQHWENIRVGMNYSPQAFNAFIDEFFDGDKLDTAIVDVIRNLQGAYKTALLSNAFSNLRHYVTDVWGFADAFDEMIISAEVGVMKPDASIYQITLDRLGVAPQEAVFLDDFERNIEGARAVGMHTIHFKNPVQAMDELSHALGGEE